MARANEYGLTHIIIAEGINFLLAGLDNDPLLLKSQKVIEQPFDQRQGMVPSVDGGRFSLF